MAKVVSTLPPARVVQINATIIQILGTERVVTLATALYVDDVTYTQYDNNALGAQKCGNGFRESVMAAVREGAQE